MCSLILEALMVFVNADSGIHDAIALHVYHSMMEAVNRHPGLVLNYFEGAVHARRNQGLAKH